MLIRDTRPFCVKFNVNAVASCGILEELPRLRDGGRIGVLSVMNAFSPSKRTSGELALKGFQNRQKKILG